MVNRKLSYLNQHHQCQMEEKCSEINKLQESILKFKVETSSHPVEVYDVQDMRNTIEILNYKIKNLEEQTVIQNQEIDQQTEHTRQTLDNLQSAHVLVNKHLEIANIHRTEADRLSKECRTLTAECNDGKSRMRIADENMEVLTLSVRKIQDELKQKNIQLEEVMQTTNQQLQSLEEMKSQLEKVNFELSENNLELSVKLSVAQKKLDVAKSDIGVLAGNSWFAVTDKSVQTLLIKNVNTQTSLPEVIDNISQTDHQETRSHHVQTKTTKVHSTSTQTLPLVIEYKESNQNITNNVQPFPDKYSHSNTSSVDIIQRSLHTTTTNTDCQHNQDNTSIKNEGIKHNKTTTFCDKNGVTMPSCPDGSNIQNIAISDRNTSDEYVADEAETYNRELSYNKNVNIQQNTGFTLSHIEVSLLESSLSSRAASRSSSYAAVLEASYNKDFDTLNYETKDENEICVMMQSANVKIEVADKSDDNVTTLSNICKKEVHLKPVTHQLDIENTTNFNCGSSSYSRSTNRSDDKEENCINIRHPDDSRTVNLDSRLTSYCTNNENLLKTTNTFETLQVLPDLCEQLYPPNSFQDVGNSSREIDGSSRNIDADFRNIDANFRKIDGASINIDGASKNIDDASKNVDGDFRNISVSSRNIDGASTNVVHFSRNIDGLFSSAQISVNNIDGSVRNGGSSSTNIFVSSTNYDGSLNNVAGSVINLERALCNYDGTFNSVYDSSSNLDHSFYATDNSFSNLERSSSNLEKSSSNLEKSSSNLEKPFSNLERSSSNLEKSSSNLEKPFSNLERSSSNLERSSSNLEKSSSNLERSSSNSKPFSNLEKSSSNLEKPFSNLEKSSSNFERSSSNLEKSSSNLEKSSSNLEKSSSNLERSSSNLEKPFSNLEWSPNNFEKPSSNFDNPFQNVDSSSDNIVDSSSTIATKTSSFRLKNITTNFESFSKVSITLENLKSQDYITISDGINVLPYCQRFEPFHFTDVLQTDIFSQSIPENNPKHEEQVQSSVKLKDNGKKMWKKSRTSSGAKVNLLQSVKIFDIDSSPGFTANYKITYNKDGFAVITGIGGNAIANYSSNLEDCSSVKFADATTMCVGRGHSSKRSRSSYRSKSSKKAKFGVDRGQSSKLSQNSDIHQSTNTCNVCDGIGQSSDRGECSNVGQSSDGSQSSNIVDTNICSDIMASIKTSLDIQHPQIMSSNISKVMPSYTHVGLLTTFGSRTSPEVTDSNQNPACTTPRSCTDPYCFQTSEILQTSRHKDMNPSTFMKKPSRSLKLTKAGKTANNQTPSSNFSTRIPHFGVSSHTVSRTDVATYTSSLMSPQPLLPFVIPISTSESYSTPQMNTYPSLNPYFSTQSTSIVTRNRGTQQLFTNVVSDSPTTQTSTLQTATLLKSNNSSYPAVCSINHGNPQSYPAVCSMEQVNPNINPHKQLTSYLHEGVKHCSKERSPAYKHTDKSSGHRVGKRKFPTVLPSSIMMNSYQPVISYTGNSTSTSDTMLKGILKGPHSDKLKSSSFKSVRFPPRLEHHMQSLTAQSKDSQLTIAAVKSTVCSSSHIEERNVLPDHAVLSVAEPRLVSVTTLKESLQTVPATSIQSMSAGSVDLTRRGSVSNDTAVSSPSMAISGPWTRPCFTVPETPNFEFSDTECETISDEASFEVSLESPVTQ